MSLVVAAACNNTSSSSEKIDLLFVVDNSESMAENQGALVAAMPAFVERLERSFGGMPSLHIGVISSDVGVDVGPTRTAIQTCTVSGDDGLLQNTPRIGGCHAPTDPYISDEVGSGGERVRNYTGDLANEIACILPLGIDGCQIEQPFEAMRRALDGRHPENAGFVRQDARLAIVFITDEDDCSIADPTIFDTLSPVTSFFCFEHGVRCDPDDPSSPGEKTGCVPKASPTIRDINEYAGFLAGLKPDLDDITVVEIAGNPDPVVVGESIVGTPALEPSCRGKLGNAVPALRLRSFVNLFGGGAASICGENFDHALTEVVAQLCNCSVATEDESFYTCGAGSGAGGAAILLALVFVRRRRRQ